MESGIVGGEGCKIGREAAALGMEAERHHGGTTDRSLGRGVVGPIDLRDGAGLGVGDLRAGLVDAPKEHEGDRSGDDEADRYPDEPRVERPRRVLRLTSTEASGMRSGLAEVEFIAHASTIGGGGPDMRREA